MGRRLRLCFVVESGTDVRLVDALAERYDFELVVRRLPGGREVSWPPKVQPPMHIGPASRLAFARFAYSRLQSSRPDFILAQGYGLAALAASSVRRPSALLVCSPVEEYYSCRRAAFHPGKPYRLHELLALRGVARLTARRAQRYVVLSAHLGDVVQSHGARRVDVIPLYGVDGKVFFSGVERREVIRERLQLPQGPLLFFSSRIAPEKDAQTLIRAVALLNERGAGVRILHRSGGWRDFLELARSNGIGGSVTATDARPPFAELADDYRAVDITVQASRAEGLGFSALESLACGTPVVAAAVGGLRETIVDGQTGWTYPPGDHQRLAEVLEEILANPEEAGRRTERGQGLVRNDYDFEKVFLAFDELVRKAVEEGV